MRVNWRALSSSLSARMALILLAGLLVAQSASLWLQWGERAAVVTQARGLHVLDRVAEAVRLLEANAPPQRQSVLAALQYTGLRVELISESQALAGLPREALQANLRERLGSPRDVRATWGGGPGMGMGPGMGLGSGQARGNNKRSVDVRLTDGQWIRVSVGYEGDTGTPPCLMR